ncbi:MAG: helix-turn-helix domain-containing protein, partial [Bacteroides sp.]
RNRIAARQIDELLAQREEQRLFLQPDFGRDELLRISRFTKNSLGDVLQRYAQAKNVAEYLNGLRVEYALKLMKEKGHLSMEAIAQEAGFNSRSTFYRAFDKATGMTPNQYLKQLKEEAV